MTIRCILSPAVCLWAFVALQFQLTPTTDAFPLIKPTDIFSPGRGVAVSQLVPHRRLLNVDASNARHNASSSARKIASDDVPSGDAAVISSTKKGLQRKRGRRSNNVLSNIYIIAGILSAISWIATANVALSFHPDPKFADCTLRHNLLTMSQAFAFPLPVAWAAFEALRQSAMNYTLESRTSRRLNLGVAVASFWLAASSMFPPMFAFGYDLYSSKHKLAASIIHGMTGMFALVLAFRSKSISQTIRGLLDSLWNLGPTPGQKNSSSYATGAIGLLYFSIQPVVSAYPLATIPTILGKRLSRPASAFISLGSVLAYCLKERNADDEDGVIRETLRKGLAWGTATHLCLIFMKIIGVDGGGLVLPGRGLWEVYPAMINVPFAAGVSFAVHAILCFGAWTEEVDDDKVGP